MPLSRSKTPPVPKGSWRHWPTPTSAKSPSIVTNLETYRTWADPLLKARFDQAKEGSKQRLNMALALLPVDATQVEYLYARLLTAEPDEVPVIRDALAAHKDELVDRLWAVVETPEKARGNQGCGQRRRWRSTTPTIRDGRRPAARSWKTWFP